MSFDWRSFSEQLQKVSYHSDSSWTLPPAAYHRPEVLDLETQKLFTQGWVGVGRDDRCQKVGDYFTLQVAGTPVIVIRDEQDQLRAYANVCRHRASTLLKGEGNCDVIRCPFHCWTYQLDGELRFAPRMEKCENFDKSNFGLVEFRLKVLDGFVFLCLDENAPELEDYLDGFSSVHAPWSLADLKTARVREMQVNCNWKAFIEVFNEYYHLPYVHPESLRGMYQEPDPLDTVNGSFTTQFGVTRGTPALMAEHKGNELPVTPGLEGRNATGTRYTWCFPNMTFAACFDSFWMYEVYPLTPERTHVVQTICFPESSFETAEFDSKKEQYLKRYDTALSEDIPFLEEQQIGMSSPFARQGRFGTLEPSVGRFAAWYAERINSAIN